MVSIVGFLLSSMLWRNIVVLLTIYPAVACATAKEHICHTNISSDAPILETPELLQDHASNSLTTGENDSRNLRFDEPHKNSKNDTASSDVSSPLKPQLPRAQQTPTQQSLEHESLVDQSAYQGKHTENCLNCITEETFYTADWRTYAAIGSMIIAILSLASNLMITLAHKKRDIKKSLYDDLLFRDMFFKPFNENLNDFIQNWSAKENSTFDKEEIEEFITDLSKVRDTTHSLQAISPSGYERLEYLLDGLEEMINPDPEKEIYSKYVLYDIYKLLLDIQEVMIEKKFEIEKIQKRNFLDPLSKHVED